MQNRYVEKAVCRVTPGSLTIDEHYEKSLKKQVGNLEQRIRFFSTWLARETNPIEKAKLKRWMKETKREQIKLYKNWTHSEYRRLALRRGEKAFVTRVDNITSKFNRNTDLEIERRYQLAGRIINRNRATGIL